VPASIRWPAARSPGQSRTMAGHRRGSAVGRRSGCPGSEPSWAACGCPT